MAVSFNVSGSAPQMELANVLRRLFHGESFLRSFDTCSLRGCVAKSDAKVNRMLSVFQRLSLPSDFRVLLLVSYSSEKKTL